MASLKIARLGATVRFVKENKGKTPVYTGNSWTYTLDATPSQLDASAKRLLDTEMELAETKTKLTAAQTELANVKTDLAKSKVTFDGGVLTVNDANSGHRVRIDLEQMEYSIVNDSGNPLSFTDPVKKTCVKTFDIGTATAGLKSC